MFKIIVYTFILGMYLGLGALDCYCADPADNVFMYDFKGKRDPFIPLIGQEKSAVAGLETISSPADLNLEGIATVAGGKQVAIINGQLVRENEKFGVLVIKKISRKSVGISIEGKDYTLILEEPGTGNALDDKQ